MTGERIYMFDTTLRDGAQTQGVDFSVTDKATIAHELDRWYRALEACGDADPVSPASNAPGTDGFLQALLDDLNTPRAIAELNDPADLAFRSPEPGDAKGAEIDFGDIKGRLLFMGALLGILQQDAETWFKGEPDTVDISEIERLIEARDAAREARDFATADRIRDELSAEGVILEDGPEGTRWKRAG